MLAIAGGIIIAVLVLANLDVILAFGIVAVLGLGALGLLAYLYQSAPVLTVVLGTVSFLVIWYLSDSDKPLTAAGTPPKPNEKEYWVAQVSGVVINNPSKSTIGNRYQSGQEAQIDSPSIWQEVGVHHDTLDDARRFARRRYDYYTKNYSGAQVRVISSLGQVHAINEMSDGEKFWFEVSEFFCWLRRKFLKAFR